MRASNFKSQIRDEMIRRFESVVSEEIKNHELSLSRYQREIDALNDRLDIFENKLRRKSEETDILYQKYLKKLDVVEIDIKQSFAVHEKTIIHIKNEILSMMNRFYGDIEKLATKQELESLRNSLFDLFYTIEKRTIDDLKIKSNQIHDVCMHSKESYQDLKNCLSDLKQKHESELMGLKKKVCVSSIDSEGVLTEIQAYKKSEFILEKKIENLYTLIERLNKRVSN